MESLEILSKHVDDISEYRIIGGEPLMNKNWSKIVDVIIEKNPKRKIYVYTNGTIAPKEEQLKNLMVKMSILSLQIMVNYLEMLIN